MAKKIRSHLDLDIYKRSYAASMELFWISQSFPRDEIYSLTSQIRRSSRSVAANTCEAWRKRRYEGSFLSKLSDAETEAAETQVWLQYAVDCKYLPRTKAAALYREYNAILGMLVRMINNPEPWLLQGKPEASI